MRLVEFVDTSLAKIAKYTVPKNILSLDLGPDYPDIDDRLDEESDKRLTQRTRRRRSDTTHLIYVLHNHATNEFYIGITVKDPRKTVYKTLLRRVQKHIQRAKAENKSWKLSTSIREWGPEHWTFGLMETVRGRAAAHNRERELIREHKPSLNTF